MTMKLALPKGEFQDELAEFLRGIGFRLEGYSTRSRSYRPRAVGFPDVFVKVFREKDIPVQVAVGNYDLGICGLHWIEELVTRYRGSSIVKVLNMGLGQRSVYVVASQSVSSLSELMDKCDAEAVRIVSEYPNLAEAFALRNRLKRFKIFPVWGAAEVYPPENAELAILCLRSEDQLQKNGLRPLLKLMDSTLFLISNRRSFRDTNLRRFLDLFPQRSF